MGSRKGNRSSDMTLARYTFCLEQVRCHGENDCGENLNFVTCSTERTERATPRKDGWLATALLEVLDEDEELCYASEACALVINLVLLLGV